MKLNKRYTENKAILIHDSDLINLNKFISPYFKRIKYSTNCIDESNIEFNNLEELLEYENPNHRKLIKIDIYADTKDPNNDGEFSVKYNPEFKLEIGGKYPFQTLEYNINSNNHITATHFESELRQRLKLIRPWYWFISKTSFNTIVGILCFGYTIYNGLKLLYYRNNGIEIKPSETNLTISEWIAIIAIIVIFWLGLIYILDKIKNYLFPKVIIQTGLQKNKNIKGNKLVYFVFAVVLLSIIINLLSSWIWQLIDK